MVSAPKQLSTYDTHPNIATASDIHANNTQGRTLAFERIITHREISGGSLDFTSDWEGYYFNGDEARLRWNADRVR